MQKILLPWLTPINKTINQVATTTDKICDKIGEKTSRIFQTKLGKIFLGLTLFGPFTVIPLVIEAWTAPNIDNLRVSTWSYMIVFDISAFLGLCIKGTWILRLQIVIYFIFTFLIWLPVQIR